MSAETTLRHFASVTLFADPTLLKGHLHARFEPLRVPAPDGSTRALVSVVTFFDRDFHFTRWPRAARSFIPTNYRADVVDRTTGQQVAWFFGTCIDSLTVVIPRYLWGLPWHRARMTFECDYAAGARRCRTYRVTTASLWAAGDLEIEESGRPAAPITGFPALEPAHVVLTHPLQGFYFRRDNRLGSCRIWHDRMATTEGRITRARDPLLAALGLVPIGDTRNVHSVLLQHEIPVTTYLPPVVVVED